MKTINIYEAKTHLSRLVDEAAEGEEIIIAKAGKPRARLVPFRPQAQPRKLGSMKGKIKIPANWDDPLPDEILRAFGVKP